MRKLSLFAIVFTLAFVLISCADSSKKKVDISGANDLIGKKISVQLGTTSDLYVSELKNVSIERYTKPFEAINALKQGKVDAAVLDGEPAKNFVDKNSDLKILEEPVSIEDYALCFSKKNAVLREQVNAAIDALRENGTISALNDYYINKIEGAKPYSSPSGIKYQGTLTMATNAEFPPYEYIEDGQIKGFDIDLARAIADLLGKELKIIEMHFDSIIAAVQSGKADMGASGITVTEARKKSVDFSQAYYNASIVIVIRK